MKPGEEKLSNLSEQPQVYKQEDLAIMIELVIAGVWSNKNLVTALHISEPTIIEWKKRPEVQDAHRKAILKFVKRRTDVEKILNELEFETPKEDPNTLVQINYQPIFGGKSVKELPEDS